MGAAAAGGAAAGGAAAGRGGAAGGGADGRGELTRGASPGVGRPLEMRAGAGSAGAGSAAAGATSAGAGAETGSAGVGSGSAGACAGAGSTSATGAGATGASGSTGAAFFAAFFAGFGAASPPSAASAAFVAFFAAFLTGFGSSGCSGRVSPSRSARRRRRSACASMRVLEWLFTPTPITSQSVIISAFVIPSSLASSCTLMFFAKPLSAFHRHRCAGLIPGDRQFFHFGDNAFECDLQRPRYFGGHRSAPRPVEGPAGDRGAQALGRAHPRSPSGCRAADDRAGRPHRAAHQLGLRPAGAAAHTGADRCSSTVRRRHHLLPAPRRQRRPVRTRGR